MAITNFWSTAPSLTTTSSYRPGELPAVLPAPTELTLTKFMNLSLSDQFKYISEKGSGSPWTVTIGPTSNPITVGFDLSTLMVTFPNPAQLPKPETISPDEFLVWMPESQIAYIKAMGPETISLGALPPDGTEASLVPDGALRMTIGGEIFTIADAGRPMLKSEEDTPPASLDPKIFLAWRDEDRQAYVERYGGGTPKSLTVSGGTPVVSVVAIPSVKMSAGVIQPTSGDAEPKPYLNLPGSANGGTVVATSAEWLFPSLDGENTKLPVAERPDLFYFNPVGATDAAKLAFLKDFADWHSAYQLEYIKLHQTTPSGSNFPRLDITIGSPKTQLTAFVSPDDPTKHFIVQSLDKAAIGRMTRSEQLALVDMDTAFTDLATTLGLATVAAADLGAAENTNNGGTLTGSPSGPFTAAGYVDELDYAVKNTKAENRGNAVLPADAQLAFKTQLDILKEQIGNSAIVSLSDIKKKVDELRDRFNRLFAFYNVKEPFDNDSNRLKRAEGTIYVVHEDVITPEGDLSGITRGYNSFLAQEKQIAKLADERMTLVRENGMLNGKRLDVPYLVYKFQSLYNLSLEAKVVAETEEINQKNDLLKTYALMQDLINNTLARFTKADDTKKHLLEVNDVDNLTPEQRYLVDMFEDLTVPPPRVDRQKHPIELLDGVTRPLIEIYAQYTHDGHYDYEMSDLTHTQWSSAGTRLSETVTIINQNSQIKMNDINSMDKERNRHFELANNALAKMADIISNIARVG